MWILGSLDATLRTDDELHGPHIRYYADSIHGADAMEATCEAAGIPRLNGVRWKEKIGEKEACLCMPWAMIHAAREMKVNAMALLAFAIEGENVREGEDMASAVASVLPGGALPAKDDNVPWKCPPSWQALCSLTVNPTYLLV